MRLSNNYTLLDQENFSEVLEQRGKVMIAFRTRWSGSCHLFEPIIKKLAYKYQNSILCYSIEIQNDSLIKQHYGVYSYPTVLFFHHGIEVDRLIGIEPQAVLETKITNLIQYNS